MPLGLWTVYKKAQTVTVDEMGLGDGEMLRTTRKNGVRKKQLKKCLKKRKK